MVPQGRHGHVITVIVEADVRTLAQVLATARKWAKRAGVRACPRYGFRT